MSQKKKKKTALIGENYFQKKENCKNKLKDKWLKNDNMWKKKLLKKIER